MRMTSARHWMASLPLALLLVLMPYGFATATPQIAPNVPGPAENAQEAARMQQEGQAAQARREVVQPGNNAPFWRDVREGVRNAYQTTTVRGLEGSYDAMRRGTVDETWAKEHHEYWYQQVMAERGRPAPGMTPTRAPASSMMEGWKL